MASEVPKGYRVLPIGDLGDIEPRGWDIYVSEMHYSREEAIAACHAHREAVTAEAVAKARVDERRKIIEECEARSACTEWNDRGAGRSAALDELADWLKEQP